MLLSNLLFSQQQALQSFLLSMVLEVLKNAVHVFQMLLKKDLMSQHPQVKPLQTLLEVLMVK